ncbi:MAG TPA: hypothetical protein VFL51_18020 [Pseudolabrys sp.]|nr:hypothetical protein [Pseudolabrys sp.]
MRLIIPLAALLALCFASTSASAAEWCGFHEKAGAVVRCGYSSLQECKQLLGDAEKKNDRSKKDRDIVCMPSPSFASNKQRPAQGSPQRG